MMQSNWREEERKVRGRKRERKVDREGERKRRVERRRRREDREERVERRKNQRRWRGGSSKRMDEKRRWRGKGEGEEGFIHVLSNHWSGNETRPPTRSFTSLVPRPLPFLPSVCIHNNTRERRLAKNGEDLGAFIT